ncbi:MAG: hypothetical protein P1U46_00095 [Patescibacteria group bacterium]|nr:hypothetical protein [Patescibacteria group bacterium]
MKSNKYYVVQSICDKQKIPNTISETKLTTDKTNPEIMKSYIVSRYDLQKTSK